MNPDNVRKKRCALFCLFCMLTGILFPAGKAYANEWIEFGMYQRNEAHPLYALSLQTMIDEGIYEKYDFDWDPTPIIQIAEIDLNNDNFPELIFSPAPEYEEELLLCDEEKGCPNIVMSMRGQKPVKLGVINGNMLFMTSNLINGFFQIDAYNKNPKDYPDSYLEHIYDSRKKAYSVKR